MRFASRVVAAARGRAAGRGLRGFALLSGGRAVFIASDSGRAPAATVLARLKERLGAPGDSALLLSNAHGYECAVEGVEDAAKMDFLFRALVEAGCELCQRDPGVVIKPFGATPSKRSAFSAIREFLRLHVLPEADDAGAGTVLCAEGGGQLLVYFDRQVAEDVAACLASMLAGLAGDGSRARAVLPRRAAPPRPGGGRVYFVDYAPMSLFTRGRALRGFSYLGLSALVRPRKATPQAVARFEQRAGA
jgi:hypothetical protein